MSSPLRTTEGEPAARELVQRIRTGTSSPANHGGFQQFGGPDAVIELPHDLLDRAQRQSPEVGAALKIADASIVGAEA